MYGRTGYRKSGSASNLGAIPVTLTLLGLNVLTFLLAFLGMKTPLGALLQNVLALGPDSLLSRPWSLVTWPLYSGLNPVGLLFGGIWAYSIGGSLERSWGWKGFLGFFAACSALTGLMLWLGMRLLLAPLTESGLWLSFAAPTLAWCQANRRETVCFNFLFSVPAPILGWITVGLTFFLVSMMGGNPLLGLFTLPAFALAFYRVRGGKPSLTLASRSGQGRGRFTNFEPEGTKTPAWNPLARMAEERKRKERDRKLAEMFKRSGYDDETKP